MAETAKSTENKSAERARPPQRPFAPRSRSSGGRGGDRDDRGGGYSRGRGGRRWRKPRVCYFCQSKIIHIDYKDIETLSRFVTDRSKIRPRRQSGTCARHQRKLAIAIKRARHVALMPFADDMYRY